MPWNAQIAKVRGGQVYVGAGFNANLRAGDRLDVYRVVDRVVDPRTYEVLGSEEQLIGTVTLQSVEHRYSTGAYSGVQDPQVGDYVRYVRTTARYRPSSVNGGS